MRTRRSSNPTTRLSDLHQVRSALLQAIEDCQGLHSQRLQLQIRGARNHRDLWMLRSDAYRLIALQHCQAVADQRIQRLLHLFEGWVAPQELSRVA